MTALSAQQYLALAQHDHESLKLLARAGRENRPAVDVSDWIVTMHFYVLCVLVKALGAQRGQGFQDHYAIRHWLNSEQDVLMLATPYRKVEEWSRDARYEGRKFNASEIARFHTWYGLVRDGLKPLLKASGVGGIPTLTPISP